MEKLGKMNKKILFGLSLLTSLAFILFIVLIFVNHQLLNIFHLDLLENIKILSDAVDMVDGVQDIVVLLKIIPEFIIILIFMTALTVAEFRNKNRFNNTIIHIMLDFLFLCFLYVNLFGNGMFGLDLYDKYLRNVYFYKIINICLAITFIFCIYYLFYKFYALYKIIRYRKSEVVLDIKNLVRILYKPFLITVLVILIIKIFNALSMYYLIHFIVTTFSLEKLIDLSNIIDIPVDIDFSSILPQFIINIVGFLGIDLNFSLSDIGIGTGFIDKLFDTFVLRRMDQQIYNFIFSRLNASMFINFNNYVMSSVIIVGVFILRAYNKKQSHLNFVLMIILFIVLSPIDGIMFYIIKVFVILLVIYFGVFTIYDNKEKLAAIKEKLNL